MRDSRDKDAVHRYVRAAGLTGPRIAATVPGLSVYGYWLDERYFFHARESVLEQSGRIVTSPALFDARAGTSRDVMPREELAQRLSRASGRDVGVEALGSACFDMIDRTRLAISVQGMDYLVDADTGEVAQAGESLSRPALYSPDGRYACVVSGYNLSLVELSSGVERLLTADGEPLNRYGQQSETALSPVSYRKRPYPVGLWSPDSEWILTHRIDDSAQRDMGLVEHAPPGGGRPRLHAFKYALPNDPLPVLTYVAIHVPTGRTIPFEGFPCPHICFSPFFFRWAWHGSAGTVWFLRFDRFFKQVELVCGNLRDGSGRVAIRDTTDTGYINVHPLFSGAPNVRTLSSSPEVIFYSERDDWGHLYLYDARTGVSSNRITSGNWSVRDIVHVDERGRRVLFLASGLDPRTDPARRVLCAINLDGTGFEVLLERDGDVSVPRTQPTGLGQERRFRPSYAQPGVSPDGKCIAVRCTSVDRGNASIMVGLPGREIGVLASARRPADAPRIEHATALAADGSTRLHCTLFLPSDFDSEQRYPLIDFIYPGPSVLQQPQAFGTMGETFASSLAEIGFVVLTVDTRKMPISSRRVNQSGYGHLLEPQLADHAAVVRELCRRHMFLDEARVGVVGQSGGGAAAARAMCDYADLYRVGVSVCGNHDSTLYAAVWSDRYRGPGDAAKWAGQANAAVAQKLRGKLLLVSGDMDENVLLAQTLGFADALIRANRDFDLLIVPNEGHLLMTTCGYVQRRIWDYLTEHLLGHAPPAGFDLTFSDWEHARYVESYMRETWLS